MAKKKNTQCDRLIVYLRSHRGITPMEAWNELGIYRLGARVWDLKHKRGYNIEKSMVNVPNRYGETCKVAQYRLEESA
jgi:hypothetical protein